MTIIRTGATLGPHLHVSWYEYDSAGYRNYRRVYIHWYTGVDL